MKYSLSFTQSIMNPYTDKRLRVYMIYEGYGRFIHESYTPKAEKHNHWIADHCIVYCEHCAATGKEVPQHSIFGVGKTPKEAYKNLQREVSVFKCSNQK